MKKELENLSSKLRDLHKDLILFQARNAEQVDERKYTPYDVLHLSIYDGRFEWLRRLSSLMTYIDEMLNEESEIRVEDVRCIHGEVSGLFQNDDSDFLGHYNLALNQDPHLFVKQGEVLKALSQLQNFFS